MIRNRLETLIDEMLDGQILLDEAISEFEKLYIQKALAKHKQHLSKTAAILGIHRNTLSKRVATYEKQQKLIARAAKRASGWSQATQVGAERPGPSRATGVAGWGDQVAPLPVLRGGHSYLLRHHSARLTTLSRKPYPWHSAAESAKFHHLRTVFLKPNTQFLPGKLKGEPRVMATNIRPLHDRVIVRRVEEGEQVRGGIIIPDTAKEKPQEGEVVAVGEGKYKDDGTRQTPDVKAGDRVLFGKYSGTEIKIDGEELLIMREDEILGILERAGAASGSKKGGK